MSADVSRFVIRPPPQAALAIAGSDQLFPVRRIWCVGRNYLEHIKEMGQDEREPPFFFSKPADAIVPDGATVPYPSLTKDLHHEVELVVAPKGRITLKCNGQLRQDGDLAQMIWNVPEVIEKLSEMVALAAGDIIMTGTPSGVAATVAGDKLECEIEGVGSLTVTIGPPAK